MARTLTRSLHWPLGFVLLAMAFGPVTRGAQQVSRAAIDLPQPVKMTTQEDHQRVMDLLGITSIPPGPIIIDRTAYDESLANPYPKVPDPLVLNNGRKVTNASMWKQRREEILEDLEREVYGRLAGNIPKVTWEVTSMTDNGKIITKQLVGHADNSAFPALTVDIYPSLTLPANATTPVAVILQLTGRGSSPSTDVAALAVSQREVQGDLPRLSPDLLAAVRLRLGPTNYSTLPWQQQVLARGWGPVYRLLGKNDMGTLEFPPMEEPLVAGELAFRQHGGARTDVSNWPTFLTFAARYQKSNGDIVRPPSIARRTISDATRGLQDITLSVKKRGGLSPLSGRWIWSAAVPGTNRKPGEITLKVKVSGSKVTGNWTEKETRNDIDGVLQVTDLSDGHVIDASSIAFKRCEGTVYYSTYTDEDGNSDQKSAITFTKCERDRSGRLKPNQTVAEFTGRISGNDLILTVKEIPSH